MNLKKHSFVVVSILLVLMLPVLIGTQDSSSPMGSDMEAQVSQIGSVAERASEAGRITSIAQNEARNILRRAYDESVTQWDVSKHLEAIMRAEGADGPLAFATLTMSGPELEEPHGDPYDDHEHIINPATEPIVMIDMGCKYQNHSADVTRTYFFENATQEMLDAYSAVLAAEEAAIAAIAPGVTIGELDDIVRSELSDYIGEAGVYFHQYWGHGVGFFVHEYPTLYSGNAAIELQVGQVLAIEPNLFFSGWAVRVEDLVMVTTTGVEVLSDSPKALDDVTITQDDPLVSIVISINNYEYNQNVNVHLDIEDSTERSPTQVSFFDGRSWHTMTQVDAQFTYNYWLLERFYSGLIAAAFKIHFNQDRVYFTRDLTAAPTNTSEVYLGSSLVLEVDGPGVSAAKAWTIFQEDAAMIRLHFVSMMTNDGSQTLLTDDDGRVVEDIRSSDEFDARNFWSPWVAGDTARLSVNPISAYGVTGVGFVVDKYEVAYPMDYTPPLTTTSPTTPTTDLTPSPTSPSPSPPPPVGVIDLTLVIAGVVGLAAVGIIIVIVRDLRS
ncbi:MAG: M24 family metallopeptidase [Candidatus Thorarchaeota archaeon]